MLVAMSAATPVAVTRSGTRVLVSGNVFRGGIGIVDWVLDIAVHGI